MKVCVFGAGAIGGLLGARLHIIGCEVSAIARSSTLIAIQQQGLRYKQGSVIISCDIKATDNPTDLGSQDIIIIAVKSPGLPDVAARISPLLAPHTVVITAMNGIPWWFFDNLPSSCKGLRLNSIDPGGALRAAIPTQQVIGCVVHPNCDTPEPGLVRCNFGNELVLGESWGGASTRCNYLADLFSQADFKLRISEQIQQEVWDKLTGNIVMNPLSALTGATCDLIFDDSLVRGFVTDVMTEMENIRLKIGLPALQNIEQRQIATRKFGAFKTSMLQDVERGKPLEIDALLTAVHEIGCHVAQETPNINILLGLIRLFAYSHRLYP